LGKISRDAFGGGPFEGIVLAGGKGGERRIDALWKTKSGTTRTVGRGASGREARFFKGKKKGG